MLEPAGTRKGNVCTTAKFLSHDTRGVTETGAMRNNKGGISSDITIDSGRGLNAIPAIKVTYCLYLKM